MVYWLVVIVLLACDKDDDQKNADSEKSPEVKITQPTELNCPNGTVLTYENFGRAFFLRYCTSCHSHDLNEGERAGAPLKVNLDRFDDIALWRKKILAVSGDKSKATMPPGMAITDEDRELLNEWLGCGGPGNG